MTAPASAVHNTGLQPQDGFRLPIPVKTNRSPITRTFKRRFRHAIDNSPALDRIYTPGNADNTGYFYEDGYYHIPYDYMRAALRPPNLEMMMRNYDAVRIKEAGFRIYGVNVQEQTAKRFGDQSTIQSVDANVPEFHMMIQNDWLAIRWEPQANEEFDDVNDDLKTELCNDWASSKLLTGRWRLMEEHVKFMREKGFLASINGLNNPPFAVEQMATIQLGTAVGWTHSHQYNGKYIATCDIDNDIRKMPFCPYDGDEPPINWNDPKFKFPNQLNRERWSRYTHDPLSQKNEYTDYPAQCCIRLDRPRTMGGDLLRNATLEIEYFATFECIPTHNIGYYTTEAVSEQTYADPWTATYRRKWSPMTPHSLALYNQFAQYHRTVRGADDDCPIPDGSPDKESRKKRKYDSNQEFLAQVKDRCMAEKIPLNEFENRFQDTLRDAYGRGLESVVKDGEKYLFKPE